MKALIFNSGLGSRLGFLTKETPKCMLKLYNGETILHRQIRLLKQNGINNIIITTGPFIEQIVEEAYKFKDVKFTFVENNDYKNTNYIVSMDNAYDYLNDDVIIMHGDLVFNNNLLNRVISTSNKNICLYNEEKQLPEKDFKGRFKDNKLLEVSINIFDEDCFAFQPLYKLDLNTLNVWKEKVREFVLSDNKKVYAENALNEVTDKINIIGLSYKDDFIDEIDNEEDYKRVDNAIKYFDYKEQLIVETTLLNDELKKHINKEDNVFVVATKSMVNIIKSELEGVTTNYYIFTEYKSNPKYEDIINGLNLFKKGKYNILLSIGGGSSIDVAKSIKVFSSMDNPLDFIFKEYRYNDIKHIVIPTTAGTGSESTTFAVIYLNDEKKSIDHGSLLPDVVILNEELIKTLPDYHKKSTLLDSLCQALESLWSINKTEESIKYAKEAISIIKENYKEYLEKNNKIKEIMLAANLSGKAINISKTTAAHALSYNLSSNFNISHGHSVSMLILPCYSFLIEKTNEEIDILKFKELEEIINYFNMDKVNIDDDELKVLVSSVNIERLNNYPIKLSSDDIIRIYKGD